MDTRVTKRRKFHGIFARDSELEPPKCGVRKILPHPLCGKSLCTGGNSECCGGFAAPAEANACPTASVADADANVEIECVAAACTSPQSNCSSLKEHLNHVEGLRESWSLDSWKRCRAAQDPLKYADEHMLAKICERLSHLPPLVSLPEVYRLQRALALASRRSAFVLHGGECAERFAECTASHISASLRTLLHMKVILQDALQVPVVTIGRLAGQYGKPRSHETDSFGELQVLTYRGDAVNDIDLSKRTPDPNRLLQAYFHSAAASNFIRHFSDEEAFLWQPGERLNSCRRKELSALLKIAQNERTYHVGQNAQHREGGLAKTPSQQAAAISQKPSWGINQDFFISHEAILLPYESALTRQSPGNPVLAGSTHFLWIGDRTRQPDFAHVEFCRGVVNPVGVKVGPSATPQEIISVCQRLNPQNIPGRVSLITRLGYKEVESKLPPLITGLREAGIEVLWVCDPLHGNTTLDSNGVKRRVFEEILQELMKTIFIHDSNSSFLAGVHLELTGQEVMECSGGPKEDGFDSGSSESGQSNAEPSKKNPLKLVKAFCDPRLNYPQAVELAFRLAETLKRYPYTDETHSSLQRESALEENGSLQGCM